MRAFKYKDCDPKLVRSSRFATSLSESTLRPRLMSRASPVGKPRIEIHVSTTVHIASQQPKKLRCIGDLGVEEGLLCRRTSFAECGIGSSPPFCACFTSKSYCRQEEGEEHADYDEISAC